MKLRNKKTGEKVIVDFTAEVTSPIELIGELSPRRFITFSSLAEFNEGWEDYVPKEPLIKDEKLRKAIRAFAELHDSKTITFEETTGGASFISRADNGYSMLWVLGKSWGSENIECDKPYTIAELCGEEEE